MNRSVIIGLSMVSGVVIGAAAVQALHAQAKPPAFVIVENAVTNQDAYVKDFLPLIQKSIRDHGGKALAAGGKTSQLLGEPPKSVVALIQYDSLEKAQAMTDSQATKDAITIGSKYATFRWFAVEGVSP
jgi:uncharacterized protein (DUF1330 family)